VHRRGVTEVPGLYFLGLSWQHTRGSAQLGFVADDAAYLADRIAAGLGTAGSATAGVTQQPASS
jgi:putative flavoprotein involved in K+ transport